MGLEKPLRVSSNSHSGVQLGEQSKSRTQPPRASWPGALCNAEFNLSSWWLGSQGHLDQWEQLETFVFESSVWKHHEKWPQKIPSWSHPVITFTGENGTIPLVERFLPLWYRTLGWLYLLHIYWDMYIQDARPLLNAVKPFLDATPFSEK